MTGCDPIILLGAGRSGTTLLYKLLSAHPDIGFLSNYQNRWPGWPVTAATHRLLKFCPKLVDFAWFKKGGGAYFNERRQWLQSLVPTPAEAESVYMECGLPLNPEPAFVPDDRLIGCLREKFEKVRVYSSASKLLTKRTANNRRIKELKSIFPEARFVHLVRDGRAVAYSLPRVSWWDSHILFWVGQCPRAMIQKGADPLDLAARNWAEEMRSLEKGLSLIEPDNLLEVRYENLLAKPVDEIQRILEFMGLGLCLPKTLSSLIDSLGLSPREESWKHAWTEEEKRHVVAIQSEQLRRWNYI